jgi:hypothetical protein
MDVLKVLVHTVVSFRVGSGDAVGRIERTALAQQPVRARGLVRVRGIVSVVSEVRKADLVGRHLKVARGIRRSPPQGRFGLRVCILCRRCSPSRQCDSNNK